MEGAARGAASRIWRFGTDAATGSAASYGSDMLGAVARAASSRFPRFATAAADGSAPSSGSDIMEAAACRIRRFATAATTGPAVSDVLEAAASRIRRFATAAAAGSTASGLQLKSSDKSSAVSSTSSESRHIYRPPVFDRQHSGSLCGLRHFGVLPNYSSQSRLFVPNKKIIEFKKKVIDPSMYDPEDFAKNIFNPMMKIPSDKIRVLATDMDCFFTPKEEGKTLFNSYRQIFFDLHRKNLSIAKPVSISDFLITESYSEFRMDGDKLVQEVRYKFVLKEGTPICRTNRKTVKDNYEQGAGVLREFIAFTCDPTEAPLARDLEYSLRKMEDHKFEKGYLSYVDPTYLLLEDRSEAFLDVYDFLDSEILPKNTSRDILQMGGLLPEQWERWDDTANEPWDETANEPRGETANEPRGETANEPRGETANESWDETAKANELLKNWHAFKEDGYYTAENPWSFLSYLRHVNRHPLMYYKTRFQRYSKAELQRLLQIKYPLVMHKLYAKLFEHKVLKRICAHRFFRLH